MSQYIKDGPDIPTEVKQALQNDDLVLFCGSGISVQNKLPLFKDLVKKVCKRCHIDIEKFPILQEAWDRKHYDSILDLIEGDSRFSVSRERLRTEVINILSNPKGSPDIHKALLELSALPDNDGYRLVTTNFDRLFFKARLDPHLSDIATKISTT